MVWDIATPLGSEAANNGDNRIRELKTDIQLALRGSDTDGTVAKFPGSDTANPKYHYRGGRGTEAAKPAAGDYGLYANMSNGHLQRDNGTSWDNIATLIPPGVVAPYAGSSSPNGWLLCDGSAVSRTTYADLFAILGVSHGVGDGSTTFNVPDYRGRFLRGVDGAAGNDPDKTSRTAMNAGGNTGNSVGSIQGYSTARPVSSAFTTDNVGSGYHVQKTGSNTPGNLDSVGSEIDTINLASDGAHVHSITGGGDNETRPRNAYVNFIIKT